MSNPAKDAAIRRKKNAEQRSEETRIESDKWGKFTLEIEVDEMVGAEWSYATRNKVKKWLTSELERLPLVNNVHIEDDEY